MHLFGSDRKTRKSVLGPIGPKTRQTAGHEASTIFSGNVENHEKESEIDLYWTLWAENEEF